MIIDRRGKYRLTEDFSDRGSQSIAHLPAGYKIEITQIDTRYRKVWGPQLSDWTHWDMPVERVPAEDEK